MLNLQDEHGIYLMCKRLEQVQLESHEALHVIKSRDTADSFFYVDPPYVLDDGKKCYQGHYAGYTMQDFEALLKTLAKIKGKFMLSCYQNDLMMKYIAKYKRSFKTFVKPLAASKVEAGGKRKTKTECVVFNYPDPTEQQHLF